jgi:5-(carboxyamino)imidazole ribonucleotide synthase
MPPSAVAAATDRRPAAPLATIGLIGGGQLAKMSAQAARRLGLAVVVLDPAPDAPAFRLADRCIIGSLTDPIKLAELVSQCDVATYDIEHIDTASIMALAKAGAEILPSPRVLDIIQDKLTQKEVLASHGLAVPAFQAVEHPDAAVFAAFGYPLVQKARRGGYDGRGVVVLRGPEDFSKALPVPSTIERFVDIAQELAVMVARGRDGSTAVYPVVAMEFDARANILDLLLAPAPILPELAQRAADLALQAVLSLEGVGIFGVELLLDRQGQLWVNELAPRPHNSGHYTIEACITCQYEQHLRAILGWPLGSPALKMPAAMVNLLGAPGESGRPELRGLQAALAISGVSVHVYGKSQTRPFRKMGHVTVLDPDLQTARNKALQVKELLTMGAEPVK